MTRLKLIIAACAAFLAVFNPEYARAQNSQPALSPDNSVSTANSTEDVYIVQPGDWLWKIFKSIKQDEKWDMADWEAFVRANPQVAHLDEIQPGMKVIIPTSLKKAAVKPASGAQILPEAMIAPASRAVSAPAEIELRFPRAPLSPQQIAKLSVFVNSTYEFLLALLLILFSILLVRMGTDPYKLRWILVPLAAFLGLRYVVWRGTATLNLSSPTATVISILVYAAEIYGFVSMGLFYAQAMKPSTRTSPRIDDEHLPTVDVFVTIFNESAAVVYKTLVGCLALDYPADRRKIYVLDDGKCAEIRELAGYLGCEYITRDNNNHAKAGNINNALPRTSGEFIMMLDCDHIPVRSFLKETLGFFKDPKVALVQTPHYFYNSDTYQHNLGMESEVINEQDLFFYVIQPGKDTFNSSFFAGSSGVFRRKPLMEIGGFQTKSLIEDLHTSMTLHAKGYRSVYLNKILTGALSPETYRSYLKQRQRWTRGGIQVFLLDNPLIKRGLSFMQRINYFASILFFFQGIPRVIYLMVPLSYLLLNIAPLSCNVLTLVTYYLPYYVISLLAFSVTSREFRSPFWSDVYETVVCFFLSGTVIDAILHPKKLKFHVTPKGITVKKSQLDWSYVMPHLILLALLFFGVGFAISRIFHEAVSINATILSAFWTLYNLLIVSTAIVVARSRPQKRLAHRLKRNIQCELHFHGRSFRGTTKDISETGMAFVIGKHILLPRKVAVQLKSDFGEITDIEGEVIRNSPVGTDHAKVGLRFIGVTQQQKQGIIRQIFSSPSSWREVYRPASTTWHSLVLIMTGWLRAFRREISITRSISPRVPRQMECELISGNTILKGITEDISITGLSILMEGEPLHSKTVTIRLYAAGKKECLSVPGEIVRRIKAGRKDLTLLGIQFSQPQDRELAMLVNDLNSSGRAEND